MPKTISLINQRGATGKTFVAKHLAIATSILNLRTVVIDLNPFGDIFKEYVSREFAFYSWHIFTEPSKFAPQTIRPNLDIIPSTIDLIDAEVDLLKSPDWEFKLQLFIQDFLNHYDVVIIDNPSSLGKLVLNSLAASDLIIIPATHEEFNYSTNSRLIYALNETQTNLNKNNLEISFLLTRMKSLNEADYLRSHLKALYPYPVLADYIPHRNNVDYPTLLQRFKSIANNIFRGIEKTESTKFKEIEKPATTPLPKQKYATLDQAREQYMRLKIGDPESYNEEKIKKTLRIYYPDWLEEQIEKEFQRLIRLYKKLVTKMESMSFEELAKRAKEMLAKQGPVTLEKAREQAMRIKIQSSNGFKEEDIKENLRIYYPNWCEKQIEVEYQRLISLYLNIKK